MHIILTLLHLFRSTVPNLVPNSADPVLNPTVTDPNSADPVLNSAVPDPNSTVADPDPIPDPTTLFVTNFTALKHFFLTKIEPTKPSAQSQSDHLKTVEKEIKKYIQTYKKDFSKIKNKVDFPNFHSNTAFLHDLQIFINTTYTSLKNLNSYDKKKDFNFNLLFFKLAVDTDKLIRDFENELKDLICEFENGATKEKGILRYYYRNYWAYGSSNHLGYLLSFYKDFYLKFISFIENAKLSFMKLNMYFENCDNKDEFKTDSDFDTMRILKFEKEDLPDISNVEEMENDEIIKVASMIFLESESMDMDLKMQKKKFRPLKEFYERMENCQSEFEELSDELIVILTTVDSTDKTELKMDLLERFEELIGLVRKTQKDIVDTYKVTNYVGNDMIRLFQLFDGLRNCFLDFYYDKFDVNKLEDKVKYFKSDFNDRIINILKITVVLEEYFERVSKEEIGCNSAKEYVENTEDADMIRKKNTPKKTNEFVKRLNLKLNNKQLKDQKKEAVNKKTADNSSNPSTTAPIKNVKKTVTFADDTKLDVKQSNGTQSGGNASKQSSSNNNKQNVVDNKQNSTDDNKQTDNKQIDNKQIDNKQNSTDNNNTITNQTDKNNNTKASPENNEETDSTEETDSNDRDNEEIKPTTNDQKPTVKEKPAVNGKTEEKWSLKKIMVTVGIVAGVALILVGCYFYFRPKN